MSSTTPYLPATRKPTAKHKLSTLFLYEIISNEAMQHDPVMRVGTLVNLTVSTLRRGDRDRRMALLTG